MGNSQNRPKSEKEEAEALSDFTCEICAKTAPSTNKFDNNNTCTHPFCTDCISKYIQVKVRGNVGKIKCPGLNCDNSLDPLAVRPIVTQGVFDKWCDNLCNLASRGLETCYCPHNNCSVLIVNECRSIWRSVPKRSQCPKCKRDFCFSCKTLWHDGYTCKEFQTLRIDNDRKFINLVKKNHWTRCPGCGNSVERVGGCKMVLCRCGTHFCHGCGVKEYDCRCVDWGFCMIAVMVSVGGCIVIAACICASEDD